MKTNYFEFERNNILISLTYHRKKFGVVGHIEVMSVDPPRAPLPISETGYLSHYCQCDELKAYGKDPVRYMREILDYYAQSPQWQRQKIEARQYSLF